MIYEGSISYIATDKDGNDKVVKERFVIENAEFFSEAEAALYATKRGRDLDVISIRRSSAKEVINDRNEDNDSVWLATVADTQLDDDGNEKEIEYMIYLYSDSFDGAMNTVFEYMKQGYGMELVTLKRTKIVDVI